MTILPIFFLKAMVTSNDRGYSEHVQRKDLDATCATYCRATVSYDGFLRHRTFAAKVPMAKVVVIYHLTSDNAISFL